MLQLDPGMMIWTWVTFVALLIILRKIAWKPLLGAVEERERLIGESLRKAEEARTEAEKMIAEQKKKLAEAQDEMQKMLKESKQLADRKYGELVAKANQDAEKLVERARADISREREVVINSLRNEFAGLVVSATSRLIGVAVDKSKHQQLIDESIAAFGKKN